MPLVNYAARLSRKEDKGSLGKPEQFDSDIDLAQKLKSLVQFIQESKHCVVLTGAGISTSAGISDFRGPHGVWTLEERGVPVSAFDNHVFEAAQPTVTHLALKALVAAGVVKFIVSQNVDGLHLRSGIPRTQLAELHGNLFMEICRRCGTEYFRHYDVGGMGLKPTGRRCVKCRGVLCDTVLDWDSPLPEKEWAAAEKECESADLLICLGTSLQITPCNNLPLRTLKAGGKVVIANLQRTPRDRKAALVIHTRVDNLVHSLMQQLSLPIPAYSRVDHIVVSHIQSQVSRQAKSPLSGTVQWMLTVSGADTSPLPIVAKAIVKIQSGADCTIPVSDEHMAVVSKQSVSGQPLALQCLVVPPAVASVQLLFAESCSQRDFQFQLQIAQDDVEERMVSFDVQTVYRTFVNPPNVTSSLPIPVPHSKRKAASAEAPLKTQRLY